MTKEIIIDGIKVYMSDRQPYIQIPFTEENIKNYIRHKRYENRGIDTSNNRDMVLLRIDMNLWAHRVVGSNNKRKLYGFKTTRERHLSN
jgi:hypothetical protein